MERKGKGSDGLGVGDNQNRGMSGQKCSSGEKRKRIAEDHEDEVGEQRDVQNKGKPQTPTAVDQGCNDHDKDDGAGDNGDGSSRALDECGSNVGKGVCEERVVRLKDGINNDETFEKCESKAMPEEDAEATDILNGKKKRKGATESESDATMQFSRSDTQNDGGLTSSSSNSSSSSSPAVATPPSLQSVPTSWPPSQRHFQNPLQPIVGHSFSTPVYSSVYGLQHQSYNGSNHGWRHNTFPRPLNSNQQGFDSNPTSSNRQPRSFSSSANQGFYTPNECVYQNNCRGRQLPPGQAQRLNMKTSASVSTSMDPLLELAYLSSLSESGKVKVDPPQQAGYDIEIDQQSHFDRTKKKKDICSTAPFSSNSMVMKMKECKSYEQVKAYIRKVYIHLKTDGRAVVSALKCLCLRAYNDIDGFRKLTNHHQSFYFSSSPSPSSLSFSSSSPTPFSSQSEMEINDINQSISICRSFDKTSQKVPASSGESRNRRQDERNESGRRNGKGEGLLIECMSLIENLGTIIRQIIFSPSQSSYSPSSSPSIHSFSSSPYFRLRDLVCAMEGLSRGRVKDKKLHEKIRNEMMRLMKLRKERYEKDRMRKGGPESKGTQAKQDAENRDHGHVACDDAGNGEGTGGGNDSESFRQAKLANAGKCRSKTKSGQDDNNERSQDGSDVGVDYHNDDDGERLTASDYVDIFNSFFHIIQFAADSRGGLNVTNDDYSFINFVTDDFLFFHKSLLPSLLPYQIAKILKIFVRLNHKNEKIYPILGQRILETQSRFNADEWADCVAGKQRKQTKFSGNEKVDRLA